MGKWLVMGFINLVVEANNYDASYEAASAELENFFYLRSLPGYQFVPDLPRLHDEDSGAQEAYKWDDSQWLEGEVDDEDEEDVEY